MNVYDFDGTIYSGDSTIDFYFYCLRKRPNILKFLPKQIKGIVLYFLKKIDKTEMKEYFYSFFSEISNMEAEVKQFWEKNEIKIKKWYIQQQKEDDIIISASPDFLLAPICKKLGIRKLIASNIDQKTGKTNGLNCKGEEKVIRFKNECMNQEVDEFYSDSYSDLPMAQIAKQAFLVNKNKIEEWRKE